MNIFCDPKNCTFFFECDPKNWNFLLNVTQRIESLLKNIKNWIFLQIWLRIQPFLNLFIWLEELNIFWYDSQNWTFFLNVTQRIVIFYKKWVPEWIFRMWLKELSHCWKILRIESFYKYDWEFNPFWTFSYDSKNWTFFDMTRRIEPFFQYDSKNWAFSQKYHSKIIDLFWHHSQNWTPF